MEAIKSCEFGITPTVRTFFSLYSVLNIIEIISAKKVCSIYKWLKKTNQSPEKTLIIGSYITGMRFANCFCNRSQITVLDIHPHMKGFLNPQIAFTTSFDEIEDEDWDLIVDTSGLGGIDPTDLSRIKKPQACIIEDPSSDGSDPVIRKKNQCSRLISDVETDRKGILCTGGIEAKTSGTMTLTMEVLRCSMHDALHQDGVLYSTSSFESYERILFTEKDPDTFFASLLRPALIVSSLTNVDCNTIIEENLSRIQSSVIDFGENQP